MVCLREEEVLCEAHCAMKEFGNPLPTAWGEGEEARSEFGSWSQCASVFGGRGSHEPSNAFLTDSGVPCANFPGNSHPGPLPWEEGEWSICKRTEISGRWLVACDQSDERDESDSPLGGVARSRTKFRLIADHCGEYHCGKFQITPHNFSELNRFFGLYCMYDSWGRKWSGQGHFCQTKPN